MSGLLIDAYETRRPPPFSGARAWLLGYAGACLLMLGVFVLLVLSRQGGPLGPDGLILRWLTAAQEPFLTGVMHVLSFLGRYYVAAPLIALIALCAWGLRERRVGPGAVALLPIGAWVELMKWLVGRPRPDFAGRLVEETGFSFPSGHAAVIATLCLLAIATGRRFLEHGPGRVVRESLLVAFAVAVGLSRIYLGAHYFSDVLAGWLLGAAWFCLCWWWVKGGDSARWRR
jgi:undecaprenyl-diphosphatase